MNRESRVTRPNVPRRQALPQNRRRRPSKRKALFSPSGRPAATSPARKCRSFNLNATGPRHPRTARTREKPQSSTSRTSRTMSAPQGTSHTQSASRARIKRPHQDPRAKPKPQPRPITPHAVHGIDNRPGTGQTSACLHCPPRVSCFPLSFSRLSPPPHPAAPPQRMGPTRRTARATS